MSDDESEYSEENPVKECAKRFFAANPNGTKKEFELFLYEENKKFFRDNLPPGVALEDFEEHMSKLAYEFMTNPENSMAKVEAQRQKQIADALKTVSFPPCNADDPSEIQRYERHDSIIDNLKKLYIREKKSGTDEKRQKFLKDCIINKCAEISENGEIRVDDKAWEKVPKLTGQESLQELISHPIWLPHVKKMGDFPVDLQLEMYCLRHTIIQDMTDMLDELESLPTGKKKSRKAYRRENVQKRHDAIVKYINSEPELMRRFTILFEKKLEEGSPEYEAIAAKVDHELDEYVEDLEKPGTSTQVNYKNVRRRPGARKLSELIVFEDGSEESGDEEIDPTSTPSDPTKPSTNTNKKKNKKKKGKGKKGRLCR